MAAATAEKPAAKVIIPDDHWRPLTPVEGTGSPFQGLFGYHVPNRGTLIWGPGGMLWCPHIKPAVNERDMANGGFKLIEDKR